MKPEGQKALPVFVPLLDFQGYDVQKKNPQALA
jgi:hypothetical protein